MINKENLKEDFWNAIRLHYEKECYSDALKDACFYIVELLQQKGEAEDLDGENLINVLFSEQKPKILINNNVTKSEKDEQRGFGFLLRGIICAVRNPLSHSKKFSFSKEEADAILIFINNYILNKLDDTKEFGYVDDWFEFVFVKNDNDSEKYSKVLLENISKKEKLNLMVSIIDNLEQIDEGKFKFFINKLFGELSKKEQEEIIVLLNKKLINVDDDYYLRMFFNHFDSSIWKKLDQLVRIRIEEMIYNSINKGRQIIDLRTNKVKSNPEGSLATWTNKWIDVFSNKEEIIECLIRKLSYDEEGKYVLNYHLSVVSNEKVLKKYSKKIIEGLKNNKKNYKDLIDDYMIFSDENDEIYKLFKESYFSFKEQYDEIKF